MYYHTRCIIIHDVITSINDEEIMSVHQRRENGYITKSTNLTASVRRLLDRQER
jgi:hypothetical protein